MHTRLEQDSLIEDALKSQPLAPMPRNITTDVVARIQKNIRPAVITTNDLILSLALAISVVALWFSIQNLPPIMVAKMRNQGILLYETILVSSRMLYPVLLFGLETVITVLAIHNLIKFVNRRQ